MKNKRLINKLVDEWYDLIVKTERLIDFKYSKKFDELSENQQNLLDIQLHIMQSYISILSARIDDLKK